MVLTRNLLLFGLAAFCFATLPSAEAQDAVFELNGAENFEGFVVQRGGPPRGVRSPSDRPGPPPGRRPEGHDRREAQNHRGPEGHGHDAHGHDAHGHDAHGGHEGHGHQGPPHRGGPQHGGPQHGGPHHSASHHGPSHGPQPCTACAPAKPCRDATICVQPTSRPCYTPQGVNAFVALFRDAAEKGVENAAIRAFNSTKVAPAASAAPQAGRRPGPPAGGHAAKCPNCQKSDCKGGCKKPQCDGKACKKPECKECQKKK